MKKAKKPAESRRRTIVNKRVGFRYTTTDLIEVGLVLTGEEIKAIRAGRMQLTGAYGRLLQGAAPGRSELWLVGAQFMETRDSRRSIKLLAHRREIDRLAGLVGQKGLTLVPKRVYVKYNRAKLELSVARGTKEYEKRARLRKREADRAIGRALRAKS